MAYIVIKKCKYLKTFVLYCISSFTYTQRMINPTFNPNIDTIFQKTDKIMLLKMFVVCSDTRDGNNDNDLRNLYTRLVDLHNENMVNNPYPDAGFDLLSPNDCLCETGNLYKIDFNIKCSAYVLNDTGKSYPVGFYIYPRSSLGAKTPLRLANSVGIIDSGYRGNLIGCFDCVDCVKQNTNSIVNVNVNNNNNNNSVDSNDDTCRYTIKKYDRLVQICSPHLYPIYVEIVYNENELGESQRNCGGFGSTGR